MALCRLHNFFIDANEWDSAVRNGGDVEDSLSESTPANEFYLQSHGAIALDDAGRPEELLEGGEHFDDVDWQNFALARQHCMMLRALLKSQVKHSSLCTGPFSCWLFVF